MSDALRFLTVVPLGVRHRAPPVGALAAFPIVGALLGLVWVATAVAAERFLGAPVAAAAVLCVDALVTGALHLDAVADVADGAASHAEPDRAIAIMREPTVGAVGAAALVLVCLLRFTLVLEALSMPGPAWPLVAAVVTGRTAMVALLWGLPARRGGSLAGSFGSVPLRVGALALGLAAALSSVAGTRGLAALAAGLALTVAWGWWWRRRFGGLSGDGAGAGGLLAETLALATVA